MLSIIREVSITGPHSVQVVYEDGETREIDFQTIIDKGGVFSPLADPEFFAVVAVSDDGRYITWPGDLDFCADAIRTGDRTAARA